MARLSTLRMERKPKSRAQDLAKLQPVTNLKVQTSAHYKRKAQKSREEAGQETCGNAKPLPNELGRKIHNLVLYKNMPMAFR